VYPTRIDLRFPSKSVYAGVARLAVAGVARASGFDEDIVFDLKTAVSEAFSTAVIGAGDGEGDKPIDLSWAETSESVVIEVRYAGGPPEPDPGDTTGTERRSLSVALLRSLLDECEFVADGNGGTTIRLTLRR
jgi:anti-sigma regulatory factor (Ser/Thr protein kinase)